MIKIIFFGIGSWFLIKSINEIIRYWLALKKPLIKGKVIDKTIVNDYGEVASKVTIEYTFKQTKRKSQLSVEDTGFLSNVGSVVDIQIDSKGEIIRVLDWRVLITPIIFGCIGIALLLNFLYLDKLIVYLESII